MNKPVKTNLSSEVANYIRKKILVGDYVRDAHLSEAGIAEELKVSRGPVREAIKQLEGEGFVFTPTNGRTRALIFGERDFRDYQRMRFQIECNACIQLIEAAEKTRDRGWIDELRRLLNTMEAAERLGDNTIINDCDYQFHDAIIFSADSNILNCMWKTLSGIRRSIMETNRTFQVQKCNLPNGIVDTHHQILDCLEQSDKEGVYLALQHHFNSGKSAFDVYRMDVADQSVKMDL